MSILIVGSQGSMGKRYQCILKYLDQEFLGVDKDTPRDVMKELARKSSGIIIATPTDTHVELVRDLLPFHRPILCEKPVTKDVAELKDLCEEIKNSKTPFRMMLQYEVLNSHRASGSSYYNYFRHGSDGLVWDCLQVIGLAKADVTIAEDSPVWSCRLNGKALNLSHMDAAYIHYLQQWFRHPDDYLSKIILLHEKTAEYQNGFY